MILLGFKTMKYLEKAIPFWSVQVIVCFAGPFSWCVRFTRDILMVWWEQLLWICSEICVHEMWTGAPALLRQHRISPATIVYRIFSSLDKLKLLFLMCCRLLKLFSTLLMQWFRRDRSRRNLPIQTSGRKVTQMISSLQKHKVVFMVVFLNLFSLHFKWTDSFVFPEGSVVCEIPAWSSQEVRPSAFDKWGAVWTEASSVPLQSRISIHSAATSCLNVSVRRAAQGSFCGSRWFFVFAVDRVCLRPAAGLMLRAAQRLSWGDEWIQWEEICACIY